MPVALDKETIIVDRVGQYGVQAGGIWYGTNEPLAPSDFLVGSSYDVLISVSKTGKKYIKQVINDQQPEVRASLPPTVTSNSGPTVHAGDVPAKKSGSTRDFDAEARGKVACSAYTSALKSPGLLQFSANLDELKSNIQHFAEFVIAKTFEHQRGKQ